jgi:IS30 family transposase
MPDEFKTITTDNGTEFYLYKKVEAATNCLYYFVNPHHYWERSTNENTNSLIRQYLRKGTTMEGLTQQRCDAIAAKLNNRPRKRLGYKTPQECFHR